MKAARMYGYGDLSVLKVEEIDTPTASEGKVVVEVHASSINPFDGKLRAGVMKEMIPLNFPVTLGGDIAGVVTEVGGGVENVAVGDKVYGQAAAVAGNSGAFAEFAATSASQIAAAPSNLDFQQAASLPLVGVSALQALTDHIKLASGQKILITGGAGGIGTIAVQIAKHLGAHVVTTATGEGIELARQLGADEVIDYKIQPLNELPHDFDAVFDTVGQGFEDTLALLKSGGVAVSMIASASGEVADELGVTAISQQTHVTTDALNRLRELIESGVVTPQVAQVFPLDEIVQAFEAKESGKVNGKVVISIQ